MNRRTRKALLAAVGGLSLVSSAMATPLIDLTVEGSTTAPTFNANGDPVFTNPSPNLTNITPGQTVYYEVLVNLAPAGTSNSNTTTKSPIGTQVVGTNGVNAIILLLKDSSTNQTVAATINDSTDQNWLGGTGNGPLDGGYFAGLKSGTYLGANAANPSIVLYGTFTAGSSASDVVTASLYVDTNPNLTSLGNAHILVGTKEATIQMTTTTETSSDPYVQSGNLDLSEAATPEPATLGLLSAAGVGLLMRRRRQA